MSIMADFHSYYLPLPPNSKCIRLLTIHPGVHPKPIHIELQQQLVNIDDEDRTPYEALSYVWGSEDDQISVEFGPGGQCSRPLTRNLAEALRYLRSPDQPRTIWIDAICIDQDHDEEKGHQVAMMGKVFQQASQVIAWLGPATATTPRAIELFNEIGSQVEVVSWRRLTMRPSTTAHDQTLGDRSIPLPYSAYDAQCIKEVLKRPWFRRLWVRQEVNLARQVVVQIGKHTMPWANLRDSVFCIRLSPRNCPVFGDMARSTVVFQPYRVCEPGNYYTFSNLRRFIGRGHCKDPRDKLYAILGLFRPDKALGIVPDYSLPTEDIYRDAALKYMSEHRDLRILQQCDLHESGRRLANLNTWVPDWSTEISFYDHRPPSTVGYMFLPKWKYLDNGVLRVAGIKCASTRAVEGIDRSTVFTTMNSVSKFFSQISPQRDLNQHYGTGGSLLDVLCITLSSNRFRENYHPTGMSKYMFKQIKDLFSILLTRWPKSFEELDSATLEIARQARRNLKGWCFFITTNDRFGIALNGTQPGDRIVVFAGGDVPIVLRPVQDGRFQVVGPCYLHEVMQGEPFLGALPAGVRQILRLEDEHYVIFYLDSHNGDMTAVDPRFRMRGIDISAYNKHKVYKNGWIREDVKALEDSGVELEYFDLV